MVETVIYDQMSPSHATQENYNVKVFAIDSFELAGLKLITTWTHTFHVSQKRNTAHPSPSEVYAEHFNSFCVYPLVCLFAFHLELSICTVMYL